jgi:large subunit ribosomal protein L22
MESLTYFKNLKNTPRKFRFVAHDVKKLSPVAAVAHLEKTNRKAGRALLKVINSAITNAKNTLKVNEDMLEFKLFTIEEGNRLKRFRPGSRGMAKTFYRRFSHVKIILTAKEPEKKTEPKKVEAKTDKKPAAKKEAKVKEVKPAVKAESKENEVTNNK